MYNYMYGNKPAFSGNLYNQNIYNTQETPQGNIYNTLIYPEKLNYVVDVPINLAKSLEGKYFIGFADYLSFGEGTNTWARLYNPPDSGVNLHVTVWTVSDVLSPFTAQIWFNTNSPGFVENSRNITAANTAMVPLPRPKINLQYTKSTKGIPSGGVLAFLRRGQPGTTLVDDEQGKFIFPPGGSFTIFLSNPQTPTQFASASIAFGWWEEPR
ncbi:DUF6143 family protein [Sedimentibacter sp. B4]|uniref:DUF6143 family protein n=1 Tax=Sedimentibacter sp. B4 TaxID=304766 RepID=UPI0002DAFFE7|nr:DUF6143 family protein [Sedimentibacter sp. B4]